MIARRIARRDDDEPWHPAACLVAIFALSLASWGAIVIAAQLVAR